MTRPDPAPFVSLKACRQATEAWCQERIRRGRGRGPIPAFGSMAWHRLPDGDPVKAASIVVAAMCWWTSIVNLERDVADELAARRLAEDKINAEQWDAATAKVRNISTARSKAHYERSAEA